MSLHPYLTAKIADERRRELIAQADAHSRVRAALDGRPAASRTAQPLMDRAATMLKAVVTRSARARRPLSDQA